VAEPLRVEVAGETNVGRKRNHNEDNLAIFSEFGLYVVADGMGGHASGEVASKMAIDTLREFFSATSDDPERTWPYKMDRSKGYEENRLITGIKLANLRIFESAQRDPRQRGMGTTIVAIFAVVDGVYVAHVGDSRVYRVRDGKLEQLTEDHSLVGELVRRGKLTPQQAEEHPQRSVITRALGPEASVQVDTFSVAAQPGDVFLLCSDGLTSMVTSVETMEDILREADSLDAAARRLIDAANENGGRDNITVVLFRIEGVPEAADADADQPTVVGEKAPTAEEVDTARAPRAEPPPRRTAPLPPRPEPEAPRKPRRGRRVASLLAVLTIVVLIGVGAWIGSRAVFFVGTNSSGIVTVYRGLPFELPGGIHLYETYYTSGVPASELTAERRKRILDHRLRSKSDASDLVRKLEVGQVGG